MLENTIQICNVKRAKIAFITSAVFLNMNLIVQNICQNLRCCSICLLLKRLWKILNYHHFFLSCKCFGGFGSHISIWPDLERQGYCYFIIWSFYNQYQVVFSKSIVTSNQFSACVFNRFSEWAIAVIGFLDLANSLIRPIYEQDIVWQM